MVRSLHGSARVDPRAAQRHRPGDRVAPRDARQRAAQLPRATARRAGDARRARRRRRHPAPVRAGDVLLRRVRARQRRAGVRARDARAARDRGRGGAARAARARAPQPPPLRRLHRARRDRRAVRRRRRLVLVPARGRAAHRPGGSTRVGSYTIRYVRPTATITPKEDRAHTGSTLALGAVLDVTKGRRHVATLRPSEGFYDSGEPAQGSVGHLIGGQPVSHISMSAGLTRDVWTAIAPDISKRPRCKRIMTIGNRTLSARRGADRDRRAGARIPQAPAGRAIPLHRLAAGHVDLDRRPDRLRRRSDRDLAGAQRACAAGSRSRARSRAAHGLARA